MLEIVQERLVESAGGAQVVNVLLGEVQAVHRVDELLQTRHDGIAATIGHAAEEHIKDRNFIPVPFIQVPGGHRQLIKIGHRGQIAFHIQHSKLLPPYDFRYKIMDCFIETARGGMGNRVNACAACGRDLRPG